MRPVQRLKMALLELWVSCLCWIPTPVGIALRYAGLKPFFASMGSVRIATGVEFVGLHNMRLGNGVRIGRHCILSAQNGSLVMDERAAISANVHVGADDGLIHIGARTAIGTGTVLRAANHRIDRTDIPMMDQGHVPGEIHIEEDVWIGANCVITADVRIGRGAVVGAGAVVTRDVEPFSIVGGVPARPIGLRLEKKKQGRNHVFEMSCF